MTLSGFLFDRLWDRGVREVFGLPGDFALNLFQALQQDGRFRLVRLSHEPSVGFAADGSARITGGLGVCCVTYGAGGLNMLNPVACAYAEESPLVVLSGGPGLGEKRSGMHVHHEVKSYESQLRIYSEVTAYAAMLDDPRTAAAHICLALDTASRLKRPVYLEIPRDLVTADIAPPDGAATLELGSDAGAVDEAAVEIVARLRAAARPVLIVGVEVHRFRLQTAVVRLAERLGIPVASSFLGRGVFPARHPQFIGTYLGLASPAALRAVVEDSDCVLLLGERISDTTLGVSAHRLDEQNLLIATARDVFIRHHRYQEAPIDLVVERLLTADLPRRAGSFMPLPHADAGTPGLPAPPETSATGPTMTMVSVIEALNGFVDAHPEVPLVCDTGDCLFAALDIRSSECIAPAYYATMGFAVPAALGVQVSSGRRPLVLVGDGAFQMTGPEIAHAPALGCNPVVVVLNNARWEMLQAFVPTARYNDTAPWPFARLAELWGCRGAQVTTAVQLAAALEEAWRDPRASVVEVMVPPGEISPLLRHFVDAFRQRVEQGRG